MNKYETLEHEDLPISLPLKFSSLFSLMHRYVGNSTSSYIGNIDYTHNLHYVFLNPQQKYYTAAHDMAK